MIARAWAATATRAGADGYRAHFRQHVLPELRRLDGYLGARLLEHEAGGQIEITVLTYWRSLDAIRAFAGDDIETAVVAEEARALLLRFDTRVRHDHVVVEDGAA